MAQLGTMIHQNKGMVVSVQAPVQGDTSLSSTFFMVAETEEETMDWFAAMKVFVQSAGSGVSGVMNSGGEGTVNSLKTNNVDGETIHRIVSPKLSLDGASLNMKDLKKADVLNFIVNALSGHGGSAGAGMPTFVKSTTEQKRCVNKLTEKKLDTLAPINTKSISFAPPPFGTAKGAAVKDASKGTATTNIYSDAATVWDILVQPWNEFLDQSLNVASGWQLQSLYSGLRIFTSEVYPSRFKCVVTLPFPPEAILNLLLSLETRMLWDPLYRDSKIVEKIDSETDVVLMGLKPIVSGLIGAFTSPRELLFLRHNEKIAENEYALLEVGVASSKALPRTGVVRAVCVLSGYAIRPLKKGTQSIFFFIFSN